MLSHGRFPTVSYWDDHHTRTCVRRAQQRAATGPTTATSPPIPPAVKLARDGSHGRRVVALVTALATGLGGLAAVITSTVGASAADASVDSTTFTSTGAEQSVVVPSGATQMHVVAVGGGGG